MPLNDHLLDASLPLLDGCLASPNDSLPLLDRALMSLDGSLPLLEASSALARDYNWQIKPTRSQHVPKHQTFTLAGSTRH